MVGIHPIYAFEYNFDIKEIEIGLENFIDKINEKNEEYRKKVNKSEHDRFEYDIIHYKVSKNPKNGIFMITIKLVYAYYGEEMEPLSRLVHEYCNEEYIAARMA